MKPRSILVAIDGSDRSMAAVHYVASTVAPEKVSVRLLHVMSPMPESFWDREQDVDAAYAAEARNRWKSLQRRFMDRAISDARRILVEAGLPADAVEVGLKAGERGIALDIIAEAQRGYDAVVLGRRGANPSAELPIGSAANKVAHALHHFPVWIVAGPPFSDRALIALDGSDGAQRALEHAGAMLGPRCSAVCLFHAIRSPEPVPAGFDEPGASSRWEAMVREQIRKTERAVDSRMEAWAAFLKGRIGGGTRVVSRIAAGVPSRAGAVMREVDAGGYGTIVMGRRGLSRVQEFAMGRVCGKVLQMAEKTTLWIVN